MGLSKNYGLCNTFNFQSHKSCTVGTNVAFIKNFYTYIFQYFNLLNTIHICISISKLLLCNDCDF